jgi:hypothetical protein
VVTKSSLPFCRTVFWRRRAGHYGYYIAHVITATATTSRQIQFALKLLF